MNEIDNVIKNNEKDIDKDDDITFDYKKERDELLILNERLNQYIKQLQNTNGVLKQMVEHQDAIKDLEIQYIEEQLQYGFKKIEHIQDDLKQEYAEIRDERIDASLFGVFNVLESISQTLKSQSVNNDTDDVSGDTV